ncbi:DUF305 domain-containing protein [uncultured Cellulomonas sp.]|uniref:DUF305 domain-containing protein n=1 Tax=uncultured Cellulomonas sp. TaxID=189682 RepID=UPI0026066530|nr:DUF305 domain-containing protein [uncultured Cellulomonas sp.]
MSRRLVAVVALLTVTALAVGVLVGSVLNRPSVLAVPADTSAEAGFARDMQAHHSQAVELSRLVRDRTDDEEVRLLAQDIMLTQQNQAGQMAGWLATWGLPQSASRPPMAWVTGDHGHAMTASDEADGATGFAAMPGWVSDEDLARLTAAQGEEAERLYLQLMIPHHQGGVEMAEMALDQVTAPQVRTLADAIVRSQQAEITVLESMLAERGGPVA